jgi:beta-fructofuranosidase
VPTPGCGPVLSLPGTWVWDFWLAHDGQRHHIFFLNAPRALGDADRRHRAARIGHAVSEDLVQWSVLRDPFIAGEPGAFDDTATWTGCVIQDEDGLWRMFYTGSRFLSPEPSTRHVETVGVAVSGDLLHWEKRSGPVVKADPRWYATLGESSGPDEAAWRDPWVFADPDGDGWHMLVTATANYGPVGDRGVVGHAVSRDLETWEVRRPLSAPGAGFAHLEVMQVACVNSRWYLLFSCDGRMLAPERAARFPHPGTWILPITGPRGPFDVAAAVPLTSQELYSGRLVRRRDGDWALMTFRNSTDGTPFPGFVTDPIPFAPDASAPPIGLAGSTPAGASLIDVDRLSRATGRTAPADSVLAEASDIGCATGGEQ